MSDRRVEGDASLHEDIGDHLPGVPDGLAFLSLLSDDLSFGHADSSSDCFFARLNVLHGRFGLLVSVLEDLVL